MRWPCPNFASAASCISDGHKMSGATEEGNMIGGQSAVCMNASRRAVLSNFLGPHTKAHFWTLSRFAQRSFRSLEPAER